MKLVNLTPHDVTIVRDMGDITIHPSGVVARVDVAREIVADLDGIPVTYNNRSPVVNLPDAVQGTAYIVSLMVAQEAPGRDDLLVPDDLVRNPSGVVTGCRSLAVQRRECHPA